MHSSTTHTVTKVNEAPARTVSQSAEVELGLLTGGGDRPYALGLSMALAAKGIRLDFIGSDDLESPQLRANSKVNFLNLRGYQGVQASLVQKLSRVFVYYLRLLRYAAVAKPKVFHILWNNKFEIFDRTLLMLYYKLLGKKVVLTAHNVNTRQRDGTDTLLNRATLKMQYRLCDHVFVHTNKCKSEILEQFGVPATAVTVIPFGINNSVPDTALTHEQAKQRLGVSRDEKTILFFGMIGPYKGLDFLVEAFHRIAVQNQQYRLVIVGKPRGGHEKYVEDILQKIQLDPSKERVIQKIEFVPDEDTELYFKAADVLVLPYTEVSQSGVIFLAYNFGLPVIATDVGSFREDVVEASTGFLCAPRDSGALAKTIEKYFESDLFKGLNERRPEIREYASARHSWDVVGNMTRNVYLDLTK